MGHGPQASICEQPGLQSLLSYTLPSVAGTPSRDRVLFLRLKTYQDIYLIFDADILLQPKAPEQPILRPGTSICPISESWLQIEHGAPGAKLREER